jgi:hypothetical protein
MIKRDPAEIAQQELNTCSVDPTVIPEPLEALMTDGRTTGRTVDRSQSSEKFSEADYAANAGRVVAHAAATGSAVVESADGKPRVIISIPTVDLPTLGE